MDDGTKIGKSGLFLTGAFEGQLVETLQAELVRLTEATEEGYRRAEFLAMNPDLDDDGLGTAIHWDTYFGPDKERYHKTAEVDIATQRLEAHKLSTAALAGSLLQFAKQGISLRYGKERTGCPVVPSQFLSKVNTISEV